MKINNRQARMTVDILMTVMLPVQMAYSLIGEKFHEIQGVILLILFLTHNIMHLNWWRNIFKGKYNAYRVLNMIINLALIFIMLCLPISGIVMSKHLFTFLPTAGLAADARTVHLCLAYWGYILMCVHLGLHMDVILKNMAKNIEKNELKLKWLKYPVIFASLYGIFAFIRRDIFNYLFLRSQFVFFDFSEPLAFFLIDYLAIMILFAASGYFIGKVLKRPKRRAA